jgi:hypothetical protein
MNILQPAIETAVPHDWARTNQDRRDLAKSLVCYVSEEDMVLSRKAFLRTVIDRMLDDLVHNTQ